MKFVEREGFLIFLIFCTARGTPAYGTTGGVNCNEDQLRQCADNAEPVFKNSEFAVPDSSKAILRVCGVLNDLTSCIGNYTKRCLTPYQRLDFERAMKEPISSMTSFCTDSDLQNEYLSHAPCMKKITTQDQYCGKQYSFLIDLLSEGTVKQVCCARAKFMTCLLERTASGCDGRKTGSQNSTRLAVAILDSSLTFMSQRCDAARFQESECPGIDGSRENSKGPLEDPQSQKKKPILSGPGERENTNGPNTHFQLDQGNRPSLGGGLSGSKPTTSTKEIKEKRPVTGQLFGNSKGQQKPETRPSGGTKGAGNQLSCHNRSILIFILIGIVARSLTL